MSPREPEKQNQVVERHAEAIDGRVYVTAAPSISGASSLQNMDDPEKSSAASSRRRHQQDQQQDRKSLR